VLLRLESPAQLHEIETHSPQIRGEDAELWRAFIARDFVNWEQKNYAPKNPLKWYEVYVKYKREQEREIARDEEILRASMGQLKKKKETNVSKVVDLRALPKVPRDPRMLANNGGVPIGKRTGLFKKEGPSSLVWSAGSKTKLTDGKSVLTRARREAKEISQRSKLAKPTHELTARAGQVRKAPAGMVNEYKKAVQPAIRILSRKKNPAGNITGGITGPSLEEREKRLSAIQAGMSPLKSSTTEGVTLVGSSDEEDEDGLDDLFDPRHITSSTSRPASSSRLIARASSSSSRPTPSTERPTSRQPPSSSSSSSSSSCRPSTNPTKPSDSLSSIVSRPKPPGSSPATRPHPAPRSRSPSPSRAERKPPPVLMRRKAEVDIFNRSATKRPRNR
jgi:elongin-A